MSNLVTWLRNPERVHHRWLGTPTVVAAWLGLTLAALSPAQGSGIALCWLHSATGLSCIGCGLTRSMSCALRGMFVESFQFHPLGMVVLAILLAAAITSLLPLSAKDRIKETMSARPMFYNLPYLVFASLLVGYGAVRGLRALLSL